MAEKKTTLSKLKPDPNNANKHSAYGTGLLEQSIQKSGVGRSILISKQGTIIAGNGVAEAAGSMGIDDVIIVQSDGKKIVAVQRTDVDDDTPEFYRLALADNIVAKNNIVMDAEVTAAIVSNYDIQEYKPGAATVMPSTEKGSYFDNRDTEKPDPEELPKEDDNQKKTYKETKYPLSIILARNEMQRWDKMKMEEGVAEDTTMFLRLMDGAQGGES